MALLTRRAFCAVAVAVSASAADGAHRVPVTPRARLKRLGVQAGVIRPLLTTDFDGTLARLAPLGYATLELQKSVGGIFGDGRVPMADVVSALSDVASRHQFIEHPLRAGREFDDLQDIRQRLEPIGV